MAQEVKDRGKELRFWVILAGFGFALELNCTDFMTLQHEIIRFRLFWNNDRNSVLNWCVSDYEYSDGRGGRFQFTRVKKGFRTGWEFQGPIRRIG